MIKHLFCLVMVSALATPVTAEEARSSDIRAFLEQADRLRMPIEEGSVMAHITLVRQDQRSAAQPFRVEFSATRERRVETLAGSRAGQRVLLTPDAYWLWMPGIANPVQMNRLQRMLGQASFGDIGNLKFAEDYRVRSWRTQADGLCITLVAAGRGQVVEDAVLCLDRDSGIPLRAEFLYPSGKVFKRLEFTPPVSSPHGPVILTTRFLNPGAEGSYVELTYTPPRLRTFPTGYFTPEALPNEKSE